MEAYTSLNVFRGIPFRWSRNIFRHKHTLFKCLGEMPPVAPVVDKFAEIVSPIPWPINRFSTPVIKRLYPLWYLRKLVPPLKYSIFSMLLGLGLILRLGSRDSVLRVSQYLIPYRKKKSGHKISSVKIIVGKKFRHWQNNSLHFTDEFFNPAIWKHQLNLKNISLLPWSLII